jgi:uncharacterized protein YukJ
MPLSDGYGVLIGTIGDYYRDDPDEYGRYYHGNLLLAAPAGSYRCAIDVDSHQSNTGVEWRVVPLRAQELGPVNSFGAGFQLLPSTSNSGAIDYIRSSMFTVRLGCLAIILAILRRRFEIAETWKRGTSIDALQDLEPLVANTRAGGYRALVYGEPFTSGLGVHNIHQNQGDPLASPWSAENGIWQDGCTILQQSTDVYVAFMNKFTTQAYWTDNQGHPV